MRVLFARTLEITSTRNRITVINNKNNNETDNIDDDNHNDYYYQHFYESLEYPFSSFEENGDQSYCTFLFKNIKIVRFFYHCHYIFSSTMNFLRRSIPREMNQLTLM